LDEIVAARLSDIFDLIEAHLRKIGKSGMLPAGIVLTGGGSSFGSMEDFARSYLKLPARVALMPSIPGKTELKDSLWSVAYGLCVYGFSSDDVGSIKTTNNNWKRTLRSIAAWFKQFLP
jgi:cell division protein FtsA